MVVRIVIACFIVFQVLFARLLNEAKAASCPTNVQYAVIQYDHKLLNQYVATGTWSQAFSLRGPVGIKISPKGIVNAGNNILNRTIDLVYTTPDCDCLSDTAESKVTVTVTGTCNSGTLKLHIKEVYPKSSALVTCTGGDSCPVYTQPYPGTTTNFTMNMAYVNGNTITQPYTCPNCSGTYSWCLQFTNEPPPFDELQPVPLVPMLHILLHRTNK